MILIKLSEDHYVLTDDSDISIGNIVAEKLLTGKYELFTIHTLNDIDKSTQKKITHSTQPLGFLNEVGLTTANLKPDWNNVEYLPLSEVKEVLGIVDVKKKAWKYNPVKKLDAEFIRAGYIQGYNEALEDKKEQKYTEKDLRAVFMHGFLLGVDRGDYSLDMENRALSTYTQPPTEWEVEFVDGKLKLKS